MNQDDPIHGGRPPEEKEDKAPRCWRDKAPRCWRDKEPQQPEQDRQIQPGGPGEWYTAEAPFLGDEEGPKSAPPLRPDEGDSQRSGGERTSPLESPPPPLDSRDPGRTVPVKRDPVPAPPEAATRPAQAAQRPNLTQPTRPGQTGSGYQAPPIRRQTDRPRPVPQRTGYVPPHRQSSAPSQPRRPAAREAVRPRTRSIGGCLTRTVVASTLALVVLIFAGIAVAAVGYVYIGQQLPPAEELWGRQIPWVSSRIFARDGSLLWELLDPHGGRRTRVTLDQVSDYVIDATVATEDETFWHHRGFSPFAIARAVYQNLRAHEIVSGFSTITQQVARNLLLSPEERGQETASRKIKEVVLAVEIERRYEKEQILEIYLNENNYGNLAYGIEAAAQTYFQKPARDLNLAEASLLAGLPQSPTVHDPFVNPDGALARQKDVLRLMVEATRDGNLDPGITLEQAEAAAAEMADRIGRLAPPRSDIPAPHFVQYVRQQVEAQFGPDLIYRGAGLRIYTTLDPRLQRIAEEEVQAGVESLADRHVTNGALVAIDPRTAEILAMVGSVDFNDESIDGQVNVALRCRQPGSSIKPLTYIAAFERGWTPATLIWDVKTEYPNPPNPPYVPVNYDQKYHGNTLLRAALANSYNVPAVKALEYIGLEGLLGMADRLGVVSLRHPEEHCPEYPYDAPPAYGLSLTLGGGETKLIEMAGAYAVLANAGIRITPSAISHIESADGDLVADYRDRPGGRVVSAQHAYLITHILSDYDARCPAYGCPNTLQLDDRSAAAKTGTTTDFKDAWTIGYTPELVTGVWVGNSDNTPMQNVPGSRGAGPIWKAFMSRALSEVPPSDFQRPPGVIDIEICADSGTRPSPYCPNRRMEIFADHQLPPDADQDLWQAVEIDRLSGLRANELCRGDVEQRVYYVVPPEETAAREWAIARGYEQPPEDFCSEGTRPNVNITSPLHNETVPLGLVWVRGNVQLPNFERYDVTFGVGTDPQGWGWISGPHQAQVTDGDLTVWDTSHLDPGPYTLRVVAYTRDGASVEARVIVNVAAPAATATREPPESGPALPTPTLPPSPLAMPTLTP
jgi:penicillin-binding protein 1C